MEKGGRAFLGKGGDRLRLGKKTEFWSCSRSGARGREDLRRRKGSAAVENALNHPCIVLEGGGGGTMTAITKKGKWHSKAEGGAWANHRLNRSQGASWLLPREKFPR